MLMHYKSAEYPQTVGEWLRCIVYVSFTCVNANNGMKKVHYSVAAVLNSRLYYLLTNSTREV